MKIKIFNFIEKLKIIHVILIWFAIGFFFAVFYIVVPGPLKNVDGSIANFFDSIYFSFITLLTIGYGDFVTTGMARIFTIIEGLIGWIIFGIIVYKIVAVKEDIILKELHEMSIEEHISRLRHYLFVCRTNIVRFANEIAKKRKTSYSDVFELELISTTLEANISDACDFFCKKRPFFKISEGDIMLIINIININLSNFVTSLKILTTKEKISNIIKENIKKIVEHCKKISDYYKNKQMEEFIEELEKYL